MPDGWFEIALGEIVDGLYEHRDVGRAWIVLCEQIGVLLEGADVGVVVADPDGHTELAAASTDRLRAIGGHAALRDEGPAHDSLTLGTAVLNLGADRWDRRWPKVGPLARGAGYRTAHGFPLRRRDERIGAVCSFSIHADPIDRSKADLAQSLADATTLCILLARQRQRDEQRIAELQHALDSRIVIEQAKGIVAQGLDVEIVEAFAIIRKYSRDNNARLRDVVNDIVARRLSVTAVRPPPGTDNAATARKQRP